jgi:WbqC-like protein family
VSESTILITQSNYIPWKGYFDLINTANEFVIYDDMQYTRRDWRNRNKIKTPQGPQWITVPVAVKGRFDQKIKETEISEADWGVQHWRTIEQNYSRAPYFDQYATRVKDLYCSALPPMLSQVNALFIKLICEFLGITTRVHWSSDFELAEDRTQRLVNICTNLGGTRYITGPAAKAYMDESLFSQAGISIHYFDYSGYPEYPQLYGDFSHEVTVLDLIFNQGPEATCYMKSFGSRT